MKTQIEKTPVIQVEISGYCNYKCKMCCYPIMKREKGFMDLTTFSKVVKDAKELGVKRLRLFIFGEPLMHPALIECMKLLYVNKIQCDISTNGALISPSIVAAAIKYKVFRFIISIDGSNQKEYAKIRVGGNYWRVVNNVLMLRDAVMAANSKMIIQVQTILMDDTAGSIDQIKRYWKKYAPIRLVVQHVQTQAGTHTRA